MHIMCSQWVCVSSQKWTSELYIIKIMVIISNLHWNTVLWYAAVKKKHRPLYRIKKDLQYTYHIAQYH